MTRPRVTISTLRAVCNNINRLVNNFDEDPTDRTVGSFFVSKGYGGYTLQQIVNESQGARFVVIAGYVPARQLYDLMYAYIQGIRDTQEAATKPDKNQWRFQEEAVG
jgi:hypothetical protein